MHISDPQHMPPELALVTKPLTFPCEGIIVIIAGSPADHDQHHHDDGEYHHDNQR